jgi:hypothetical protein
VETTAELRCVVWSYKLARLLCSFTTWSTPFSATAWSCVAILIFVMEVGASSQEQLDLFLTAVMCRPYEGCPPSFMFAMDPSVSHKDGQKFQLQIGEIGVGDSSLALKINLLRLTKIAGNRQGQSS